MLQLPSAEGLTWACAEGFNLPWAGVIGVDLPGGEDVTSG